MHGKLQRIALAIGAATLAIAAMPATADAKTHRVYKTCRRSSGTAGLIAGGGAGAVIGSKLIGGGIAGPLVGAVGGAVAGREIDRSMTAKRRCHYTRRR